MGNLYIVKRVMGSTRNFLLFVLLIALFLLMGVGGALFVASRSDQAATLPSSAILPATGDDAGSIGGGLGQKLQVNAQLQVNGQFYLAPSQLPENASAGTIVFDQATSTLQYYNGSEFVSLVTPEELVIPEAGVTSLQGQTGAITLVPGVGITINGTQISSSGILGINGVPGDINVTTANGIASLTLPQSIAPTASPAFNALTLANALPVSSGGTGGVSFAANGVLIGNGTGTFGVVAAPAPGQCLLSTAGAPEFGACAGGGSGVSLLNGLSGNLTLANATGLGASITIDDATTSSKGIAQFNATNFSVAAGVVNTIQNIGTGASPTFAGLTLSAPLSVASGGLGASTLTANSILVGNGAATPQQVTAGVAGQCLISTAGAPIFTTCPGSGGVASIDGQTGIVTINNATGAAGVITIDDATTGSKGIAQFNATNFSVAAGVVNTIQGISASASPTFAGLTLTSPLAVGSGGTGANNASGARSNLGAAASGANSDITSTTALNTITPSAALTVGSSGQQLTLQGNASTVFRATNAGNTTTVGFIAPTANVNINFPALAAGTYQVCTTSGNCLGGGTGGANTSLSNLASVAINTSLLSGSSTINLGSNANPFLDLYLGGTATNNFRFTGTASAARTITIPDETGTICLSSGNCIGSGGGAPAGASFLTLGLDGGLSAERVLTAGTNISFADGGPNDNFTISTVANPSFGTSVTTPQLTSSGALTIIPGGPLTIGATTQGFTLQGTQASTITARNGSNITTIGFVNPTASTTINFPALTAGTYEICTSFGNCAGSTAVDSINTFTGAVTVQGTANQIIVNNNAGTITLSTPQDINTGSSPTFNGLTLTSLIVGADTITDFTGTGLQVVGNALQATLGVDVDLAAEVTGILPIANGGTNSTAVPTQGGIAYGTGTAYAFTAAGTSGQCLVSNGTSAPTFQTCAGGGSGVTLQAAYNNGNTITTTDARDIVFTLADTAADADFIVNIAGDTGTFVVQENGINAFYVSPFLNVVGVDSGFGLEVVGGATTLGGVLNVAGIASFNGNVNIGNAATDRLTVTSHILGASPLVFQGATDNAFATTFAFSDPTGNRTITFSDASGTIVLDSVLTTEGDMYYRNSSGLARLARGSNGQCLLSTASTIQWNTCGGSGGDILQGGNNLGGTTAMTLGTINNGAFNFITNNTTRWQITTAGLLRAQNGATISVPGTGNSSQQFGLGTDASGIRSLAVGNAALATGNDTVALGQGTAASGGWSMALGSGASAGHNFGIALGDGATTTASNQLVIGRGFGYINQVYLGTGVTAASPQPVTINSTGGSGTDVAGANITIAGGRGTGAADGGSIIFQTSVLGASGSTLQNLATRLTIQPAGNIIVGVSNTTGTLLVLDTKTNSGDPTGVNGGMYYNSSVGKFRCYEGNAWKDCIPAAGGAGDILQGGNNLGGTTAMTLGTINNGAFNLITNNTTRFTLTTAGLLQGQNGASISVPGSGAESEAFGLGAISLGWSVALGFETEADDSGTAIGWRAVAGEEATSLGRGASSLGTGIALGAYSSAAGASVALGYGSSAEEWSVALGRDTSADYAGIAIGSSAEAGENGIAIGDGATAGNNGLNIAGLLRSTNYLTGNLVVGQGADTTGQLLVLDTKTNSGDPAGVNGGMYYNSDAGKFRCYEGGAWKDCITEANGMTATYVVAANDSPARIKAIADYVADGTDDQVEINAALTAGAGGKVYLAEGTYTVGATILVPNDTTLEGAGEGTVVELDQLGGNDYIIENADTVSGTGVRIQHLTLDGRDDLNTSGFFGGILFTAVGSDGITKRHGGYVADTFIRNVRGVGIHLIGSANTIVKGNTIYSDTLTQAINLAGANHNVITENILRGGASLGAGILNQYAHNNTIADNKIQRFQIGISLSSAWPSYNSVTGNTVIDSSGYGIALVGVFDTQPANNNTIAHNKIQDSGGGTANNGIYLQHADYNSIVGNTITDTACTSSCDAVRIVSISRKNHLEGNRFSGSTAHAATINDAGTGTIYANQQVNGTTSANSDVSDFRFRGSANSATAFQIQNASGVSLFTVDNTNDRLYVGNPTADGVGTLLVLDTKNTSGDPTGANGSMYYNSDAGRFRCYQGGSWMNCITDPGGLFTDTGSFAYLTQNTDSLSIGGTTDQSAKLQVIGTSNQTQLLIRNNSTQTSPVFMIQNSGGTEMFRLHARDQYSLFLGFNAGANDNGGNNGNIGIGHRALQSVTGDDDNIALGAQSLRDTTGGANIALGTDAMINNASGSYNIALGKQSSGNNNGNENVVIGHRSMWLSTSSSGSVIIGNVSAQNLGSGDNNILLGSYVAGNLTSGSNNIIIGQNLNAQSATGSNQLNVAGLLTSTNYTSATIGLTVNGRLTVANWAGDSGTDVCRDGNTLSTCSSLAAQKHDIAELNVGGLNTIMQLQARQFTWNKSGTADYGFIAEEVAAINPLLAQYEADGSLSGVRYRQMTALLVQGVQELAVRANNHESRIAALEVVALGILPQLHVSGHANIAGNITVGGKIISAGDPATAVLGAQADTTSTVAISGNDTAGTITYTTNSDGMAVGEQVKVTFSSPYGVRPRITLTPVSAGAAATRYYVERTATQFTIHFIDIPEADTVYKFDYQIIQ